MKLTDKEFNRIAELVKERHQVQSKLEALVEGLMLGKELDPEEYSLDLQNKEFVKSDEG